MNRGFSLSQPLLFLLFSPLSSRESLFFVIVFGILLSTYLEQGKTEIFVRVLLGFRTLLVSPCFLVLPGIEISPMSRDLLTYFFNDHSPFTINHLRLSPNSYLLLLFLLTLPMCAPQAVAVTLIIAGRLPSWTA